MEGPIENNWSYNQKVALTTTTKVSSSLSIFGSLYIIWHNLRSDSERSERLQNVYNRLLLSISICDFFASSCGIISTWAIPADDTQDFIVKNFGNQTTCNLQGFFIQFTGFAVALYNASLSIFFLLSTRYRIRNDVIRRKIEPFFHIISLGYPFAIALYAVLKGHMNPTPTACWIAEYPRGCVGSECIRGEHYVPLRMYGALLPIFLSILVIIVSMCMLYSHVKRLEDAVHSYSSRWTRKLSGRQSKRVFRQASLYIGAFFTIWTPYLLQGCVIKILYGDSARITYWTLLATQIFSPLQGLFNALIYARINPVVELGIIVRSSLAALRRSTLWTRKSSADESNENDIPPRRQSEGLEE